MKEYKGENILKEFRGRLESHNAMHPDCICELIWTDEKFFVLEDNYDGTYVEYFAIPIDKICSIQIEKGSKGQGFNQSTTASIVAMLFGALAGILVFIGGKKKSETNGKVDESHVCLEYFDKNNNKELVFFAEMRGKEKAFVSYGIKALQTRPASL